MTERHEFQDWEERYRQEEIEMLPWYHPDLDHDFERTLEELHITGGRVLDLGTGPGTQAIALAKRGFDVTAIDISETAIAKARRESEKEDLAIDFLRDDILENQLEGTFDLALDRGCFHVLEPDRRVEYVEMVHRLIGPGGYLFLKCFSHLEPGDEGPYRFTTLQVTDVFRSSFDIVSTRDSIFQGNREPPPRAIFCVLKRR